MTPSKTSRPARYRVYQFFVALKAGLPVWLGGVKGGLTAEDERLLQSVLPADGQQQLFARMPANDQRHALAVAYALQQAGYHQPALMQAALLHDVAKSLGQPIIHRVLIVLLEAFWPAMLKRLSTSPTLENHRSWNADCNPHSESSLPVLGRQDRDHFFGKRASWWRRPFVVHARHPAIGADWAKSAGCEPLAVSLIARHQDILSRASTQTEEELLAALQWADNSN
jgi:hypothetical protein